MTWETIISIADVLNGESCAKKIVDMGFWFDIPFITKKTLKVLVEKGACGVRFVLTKEIIEEVLSHG